MLKLLSSASPFSFMVFQENAEGASGEGGKGEEAAADVNKGSGAEEKTYETGGETLLEGADEKEAEAVDFAKGKPEGFPDEAWDEEAKGPKSDVLYQTRQAAEKMAKDLRAKMGKGDHKAPKEAKEYVFKPSEKAEKIIPKDDPFVAAAAPIALKHGLSKEQFTGFMTEMADSLADLTEKMQKEAPTELTPEQKAEIRKVEYEKIGTNAIGVIKAVESWGRELKATGQFSEEDMNAFKSMAVTGEQVRVLNKLRSIAGGGNSLPMDTSDDGLPSDDEIAQMQVNVKNQVDQDKVDKLYEKRRQAGRPERLQIRA